MERKKTIVLVSALLLVASVSLWAQQRTVAVSLFEARGGLSQDVADVVTELVISELVADRTVKVVDRNNFEKIIAEMKFQNSDWGDNNKVTSLGKALGADSIIRGTVMTLGKQIIITSSILDLNTVQIINTSRLQVNNEEEIFNKIPEFANGLVRYLWTYKVGDTGPGGGIIFFTEGGKYMEVSPYLGQKTYNDAVAEVKNYKGGGYTDWKLPDKFELNLIYTNLHKSGIVNLVIGNLYFWSSSTRQETGTGRYDHIITTKYYVSVQRFSDGYQEDIVYRESGWNNHTSSDSWDFNVGGPRSLRAIRIF